MESKFAFSLNNYRVREDLDIFVIEDFARDILGFDAESILEDLSKYPVRGAGDGIPGGHVQWVEGNNEALKYRGNDLKRGKIWLQRPGTDSGYLAYRYTGWQWRVLPATASLSACPEVEPIADTYDRWAASIGAPPANHYIITKYKDGQDNIGFHSDKTRDIDPESLITVVKTGRSGRLFELCNPGEEKTPFFSKVLAPGTAVIMTVEANLATKHGVPVTNGVGPSGSIVFRTICTCMPSSRVEKELAARRRKRERDEA